MQYGLALYIVLMSDIIYYFAGCAAAWVDTVEQLGSGKLSLAEVLEPAIRLAEEGYINKSLRSERPS